MPGEAGRTLSRPGSQRAAAATSPPSRPNKSKGEGGRAQMDPGELLRHPVATLLSSDAEKSNRVKMTSEAASLASPARLRAVCTCE